MDYGDKVATKQGTEHTWMDWLGESSETGTGRESLRYMTIDMTDIVSLQN